MMVIPHRPYLRVLIIFVLVATFLLAVTGSFLLGGYYSVDRVELGGEDITNFKLKYEEQLPELAKLEQQAANLRLANEVDRKANEEVRGQVVYLKTQLAEMEQDNTFYRGLMRPNANDQGLVVDAPSVAAISGSIDRYKFNVVIKQIVAQHRLLSGYLEFELLGRQAGVIRKLALKDVSDSINVEQIKLRFKYFQRIEGEMLLPEGFVTERIHLKVVIQGPKKAVIEKKFGWLVKKS
ncbi:MAG: hypothetical protein ACJAUP_002278 [Cellvibrionaceae bacterium]|jgi:hypothetical protein